MRPDEELPLRDIETTVRLLDWKVYRIMQMLEPWVRALKHGFMAGAVAQLMWLGWNLWNWCLEHCIRGAIW